MFRSFYFLCCVFTLPLAVLAKNPQYGDPIPAQAWEVESDPARGIQDAAYLEHITQLKGLNARHYRLIRILSEEGKKAATFEVDREILKMVRGRVIERDGTVTQFERGEDFVTVTTSRSRSGKSQSTLLIPPGLTEDCIVELEWNTRARAGIEVNRNASRHVIREPYFCMRKVIDLSQFHTGTFLYFREAVGLKPTIQKNSNTYLFLEYSDVAPSQSHPFENVFFDPETAYVLTYRSFFRREKNTSQFWSNYCRTRLRGRYSSIQSSSSHREWVNILRSNLEADSSTHPAKNPVAAAKETLEALYQRISTTHLLTADELEEHRNAKTRRAPNIERIFREGRADAEALTTIYIGTLRQLGIQEKLIFTTSTLRAPLNPEERFVSALNPYLPLVLVEQKGQSAVFCPWEPALAAGQYPSHMQGLLGLFVDPNDDWAHRFDVTPTYGPETNLLQTTYHAQLDEEGTLAFHLKKVGTGNYNKDLTERYYSITDEELSLQLRERWQRRLGQEYQIEDIQLEGRHEAQKLAVLTLNASRRINTPRDWLPITPFPGSHFALRSPREWLPNRTGPIFLEQPFRRVDTMILKVPANWQLRGQPRWQKSNEVGEVTFLAIQEGETVTIQRTVTLAGHILAAEKQEQLRLFLAWIDEVSNQQIGVLKGGA